MVEEAREKIAALIGADASEIIFTSGATESDNLAIKGAAHLYQRKGRHLVTMKTEHKAVLDSCMQLEKEGYAVTYLSPEADGRLNLDVFRASLRPDTTLVSIMHVNNETGVIQDLAGIAAETSARGAVHSRRRTRARHAIRHAARASDSRHGRGICDCRA